MASSDLVLFAIRSALRLGVQARAAYVDATRRRSLILPLPNYQSKADVYDAVEYFNNSGKRHIPESKLLGDLRGQLEETNTITQIVNNLSEDQKTELMVLHSDFATLDLIEKGFEFEETSDGFIPEDVINILRIRQWRKGNDPHPTLLRRFAGTFIEIGVDYFGHIPGALNKNSRHGKALYVLFTSLDEIKFSEEFAEQRIGDLPGRLLIATLESVSENSEFLSGDPKYQKLIAVTSKALVKDVAERIKMIRESTGGAGNEDMEERVTAWAELVFRSVLASGGRFVASNPKEFLGIEEPAESELVYPVGHAVLGFVLDQPQGHLDRVFGREGLEVVIRASLSALARHPALLFDTENRALKSLLSQVASALGKQETILKAGILPDVTRMILDRTGENLYLLWPKWAKHPENHLLLTAARTVIDKLTSMPSGAKWKPQFTRDDMLTVLETTFDAFVNNPGWLIDRSGKVNDNLKVALEAMLGVLRKQQDRRLSTQDASQIISFGLKAVAHRQEFLESLPNGPPMVAALIDAILRSIFRKQNDRAAWSLVRSEVILGTIKAALNLLAEAGVTEEKVKKLGAFMKNQVKTVNEGKAWSLELFESELRAALGMS
ncbi:MAG: hypothetical protein PVJ69_15040 [Desulfobacteraceae bacterium]|jgi:hypothetical protein